MYAIHNNIKKKKNKNEKSGESGTLFIFVILMMCETFIMVFQILQ